MLHAILSIFVGVLGGLSARVIYSFVASIALLPLSLLSSKRKDQVSIVQAALALCLLVAAVSLYDFGVIKSWKGIVDHLTWGDYIGIVVFCISSACIPDNRSADKAGDCEYNKMILNAGVYFSLFIPVGFLLMNCSKFIWAYSSFLIVFLLILFKLIDFYDSKKSMKRIFIDRNSYPRIRINDGRKYANENESIKLDSYRIFYLGIQCFIKGEMDKAVSCFKKSAELGNAEAQWQLGACYFVGKGIRENKQEAVKWFRLAAGQGNAEAQWRLGFCYFYGEGIWEDKQKAVKWFRLAAEQGGAEAQWRLGVCYFGGEGIREDKQEAVKWFRLAAGQGNAEAQWRLGVCYFYGEGIWEDKQKAVKWLCLSAKQGNADALDLLRKSGV